MDNLLDAVIDVESEGKPLAKSIKGARGVMQITQPALTDYNRQFSTSHSLDDMYDEKLNRRVGTWYLMNRVPQLLTSFKLPVTLDNILWAYNAGIGNVSKGIKPKETVNYIDKVKSRLTPVEEKKKK